MLYTQYHIGAAGGKISSKTPIADDKWDGKLDLENKNGAGGVLLQTGTKP